jgi:transcriptional regulator with XRE-family HTH domain
MYQEEKCSRIKVLRLSHNLTQMELAELTGVDRTTISKAEHGKAIRLDAGIAIAYALDTTVEYLFGHLLPANVRRANKKTEGGELIV